jgi:exosortase
MRGFDIPVLRDGNVIELMPLGGFQTKKLEVVEACSGIRSLMTLVTLAVVFAYFTYPRPTNRTGGRFASLREFGTWRSLLIVLAAVPIAIITNALRVSGTGVLAHYYGTEVADGFFHSFSGWVVYILAFLLLFGFAAILDGAMRMIQGGNKRPPTKPKAEATSGARASDMSPIRDAQVVGEAPALHVGSTSSVE